ncbi:hypothetical protein BY458DRAFT_468841 [Sporodiniella umbellata]|nr:hypothetical protein BY458DRAFT_468841 [Sporodiniella umbellata]
MTNENINLLNVSLEFVNQLEPLVKISETSLAKETAVEESWELESQEESDLLGCRTCQLIFNSRGEQRTHYVSDFHRYNIKTKLELNESPVGVEEFLERYAKSMGSSSECAEKETSDSEEEEEEEEEEDRVDALVSQQKEEKALLEQSKVPCETFVATELKRHSALVWFRHKENTKMHYGIYRSLMVTSLEAFCQNKHRRYWSILMLGGGHFAGCVIDTQASLSNVKFVEHKTIHRYTTRRKQGGSQSANDNGKGKANSVGAQIRRHNEQRLKEEVRQIIGQWKEKIVASEFVFIYANSANRNTLFQYDGAILNPKNTQSIPFTTQRPTLDELKRVYLELTTVKAIEIDEQAFVEGQKALEEKRAKRQAPVRKQTEGERVQEKKSPSVDPEIEKLLSLVKQNKTSVTLSFIEKHDALPISGLLPKTLVHEDLRHYPTLLHRVASLEGTRDLILALLTRYSADPTIVSDAGKTAYEMCKEKENRNAFRRCMCDFPDQWPWLEKGRVPSPLTREQEEEQIKKEKKKQEKENERKKRLALALEQQALAQQAVETRCKEPTKTKHASALHTLGGNRSLNTATMTPEARMRLEREMRARAAEERIKKLSR